MRIDLLEPWGSHEVYVGIGPIPQSVLHRRRARDRSARSL